MRNKIFKERYLGDRKTRKEVKKIIKQNREIIDEVYDSFQHLNDCNIEIAYGKIEDTTDTHGYIQPLSFNGNKVTKTVESEPHMRIDEKKLYSLIHELGHLLDFEDSRTGKRWSENKEIFTITGLYNEIYKEYKNDLILEIKNEILNNNETLDEESIHNEVMEFLKREESDYIVEPKEIFARMFDKYYRENFQLTPAFTKPNIEVLDIINQEMYQRNKEVIIQYMESLENVQKVMKHRPLSIEDFTLTETQELLK